MKNITLVQTKKNLNLVDALRIHLAKLHRGTKFATITSQLDMAPEAELAGRGMPQFVSGNRPIVFHNVGIHYDRTDTQAQKDARFAIVNNPESTIEEILPQLGYVDEIFILPAKAYTEVKALLTECRLNISEAETDAEILAAYKQGFQVMKDIFLAKPAAPVPAADSDADDDSAPGI